MKILAPATGPGGGVGPGPGVGVGPTGGWPPQVPADREQAIELPWQSHGGAPDEVHWQ